MTPVEKAREQFRSHIPPELRERIAKALGWTVGDTYTYSLRSLRENVRGVDDELVAEITRELEKLETKAGEAWPKARRSPRRR